MDIITIITLTIAICGLILAIINLIRSILHERRVKTLVLKLPTKKRLFKELYNIAEDLFERIVLFEGESTKYFVKYPFRIKKRSSSEYVDSIEQEATVRRYIDARFALNEICGYKKVTTEGAFESWKYKTRWKTMSLVDFTFPKDQTPENAEEIKNNYLSDLKRFAKENGVKL